MRRHDRGKTARNGAVLASLAVLMLAAVLAGPVPAHPAHRATAA